MWVMAREGRGEGEETLDLERGSAKFHAAPEPGSGSGVMTLNSNGKARTSNAERRTPNAEPGETERDRKVEAAKARIWALWLNRSPFGLLIADDQTEVPIKIRGSDHQTTLKRGVVARRRVWQIGRA